MNKLKFETHRDDIPFIGSHFQGRIDVSYNEIKKVFGLPTEGDSYKVDAEWEILFEDGVFATIYNYEDGKNYNGKHGIPKTKIRDWHVGGISEESVEHVKKALNLT